MKKMRRLGFTIIEVVLVLGVAGLIFIVVFTALPGMQVSARDTQRRESIMTFVSKIKEFQTNNRGALPSDTLSATTKVTVSGDKNEVGTYGKPGDNNSYLLKWAGFYRDYLGDQFRDPSGYNYNIVAVECGSGADVECVSTASGGVANVSNKAFGENNYNIIAVVGATCYGDTAVGTSSPRKLAVLYKLEGAGVYCQNT